MLKKPQNLYYISLSEPDASTRGLSVDASLIVTVRALLDGKFANGFVFQGFPGTDRKLQEEMSNSDKPKTVFNTDLLRRMERMQIVSTAKENFRNDN